MPTFPTASTDVKTATLRVRRGGAPTTVCAEVRVGLLHMTHAVLQGTSFHILYWLESAGGQESHILPLLVIMRRSRPLGIVMLAVWGSIIWLTASMRAFTAVSWLLNPTPASAATKVSKSVTASAPDTPLGPVGVALVSDPVFGSLVASSWLRGLGAFELGGLANVSGEETDVKSVKMELMSAIEKTNDKIEQRTDALTAKGDFSSYLAVGGAVFTVTSTIFVLFYQTAKA